MPQEITLATISQQMSGLSQQMGEVVSQLAIIDGRLARVEGQLTKVEKRLDRVEEKLGGTFEEVGGLKVQITEMDERLQATQHDLHDYQVVIAANALKTDLAIQNHERRLTTLER